MQKSTNQLIHESSLYLQQHAHNPVNWYAWNEVSLALARRENKPILLSIGYSACHWCHVMAHESFEDQETANLMNEWFVNIKVDREERPDLDKVYQLMYQLFTKQPGGWPLTVFLTPDNHIPFFVGTYFPKTRGVLPSFQEILKAVHDIYLNKKEEIAKQNQSVLETLTYLEQQEQVFSEQLNLEPIKIAKERLLAEFDAENGGFGTAPKFPQPGYLTFLINQLLAGEEIEQILPVMTTTLSKMADRGLFDHLGGGFFRYCVDAHWNIPHFEKMLYDNAQLLKIYADMSFFSKDPKYVDTIKNTANWVLQDMQGGDGHYDATLSADTEGKEGHFYVWDKKEIESLLTPEEFNVIALYFGLDKPPNFEGKYHLFIHKSPEEIATMLNKDTSQIKKILTDGQKKLLQQRNMRVKPEKDQKTVIAWNALMVEALGTVGKNLKEDKYIKSSEKALKYLKDEFFTIKKDIFLDDFAFLAAAVLKLLQYRWRSEDLIFLIKIVNQMIEFFEDKAAGGFYFAQPDANLIYRTKQYIDESTPSGNAIATQVILRLGYLLGDTHYIQIAERSLKNAFPHIQRIPEAHGNFLKVLEEYMKAPEIIVVRGSKEEMLDWQVVSESYKKQGRLFFFIPAHEEHLPEALQHKTPSTKGVAAYYCKGTHCLASITNIQEFENVIR